MNLSQYNGCASYIAACHSFHMQRSRQHMKLLKAQKHIDICQRNRVHEKLQYNIIAYNTNCEMYSNSLIKWYGWVYEWIKG